MTPFSAAVRAEWTKLSSLRSSRVMLVLAVLLSVGLTTLIAWVVARTWSGWPVEEQAAFDPIGFTLIGGLLSGIIFIVLGVTTGAAEYGSGMIRLTFTVTPRRGRVLAAKALVIGAATGVLGLASSIVMFLAAQAVFALYDIPRASLTDADALRAVLTSGALTPVLPVIAVALGMALRSTAGAITSTLGLVFVPAILGGLLPVWWQRHVLAWLPSAASDAISIAHLPDAQPGLLSPALAVLALAGWLAVFLGLAWVLLERRDA